MSDDPMVPAALALELEAAAYRRGYRDCYEAVDRSWRAAAAWRPGLIEADQYVTIGGKRERVLSWRDRNAADMAVLREAHAAGLHDSGPARSRCPVCSAPPEGTAAPRPADLAADAAAWCAEQGLALTEWQREVLRGFYSPSPLQHNGHYGVCTSHSCQVPICGCAECAVTPDIRHPGHAPIAHDQMAAWLSRRGVGLTPTPGTVRRGVELDHAEALQHRGHYGVDGHGPNAPCTCGLETDTIKPHYGVPGSRQDPRMHVAGCHGAFGLPCVPECGPAPLADPLHYNDDVAGPASDV